MTQLFIILWKCTGRRPSIRKKNEATWRFSQMNHLNYSRRQSASEATILRTCDTPSNLSVKRLCAPPTFTVSLQVYIICRDTSLTLIKASKFARKWFPSSTHLTLGTTNKGMLHLALFLWFYQRSSLEPNTNRIEKPQITMLRPAVSNKDFNRKLLWYKRIVKMLAVNLILTNKKFKVEGKSGFTF